MDDRRRKGSKLLRILVAFATVLSCVAVVLALDLGRLRFRMVDAGGHALRMLIAGRGSPTVVFEAGGSGAAGGPLEAWQWVQPRVSQFATTVAYDRAGIGRSTPGPKPRDARQIARELHTALHNASLSPPYILVGHSFGGPLNRVFADLYPAEVGGLILVDPTQEEFINWNQARDPNRAERQDEEWKEIQASLTQARQSRVPEGIPVILITAMGPRVFPKSMTEKQKEEFRAMKQMWLKFHNDWLNSLSNGEHVVTEKSGHGVPFEEPDLVVRAIRQVVEKTRGP
jgi:pimeloyl-ACP methyl ester carboxylesterase